MASLQQRIWYIQDVLSHHNHMIIFAATALVFFLANVIVVLYIHQTIGEFYRSMFAMYTVPFTLLVIITSLLFGINVALLVAKLEELRFKSAGLSIAGLLFGSLAAGCPGCFFGLFPIILSLFGITGTLAILPLNGIELQIVAILVILASIYFLAEESTVVCKI
jgi:hypothetical protein